MRSSKSQAEGHKLTYVRFKYRQADGSNNNPMYPKMGAANTPYARTVCPLHPVVLSLVLMVLFS